MFKEIFPEAAFSGYALREAASMSPKTGQKCSQRVVWTWSGGNRESFSGTNSYTLVVDFPSGIKAEMLSKKSPRFEHYVAERNGEVYVRDVGAGERG